ncbi:uncharacterized protein LOC130670126 [Microplitis mediator]|uniref:uncharacterized protein LOC130670126 n=1 Tax=Microplitis mediator TaxID=375433 RepID=UPI002553A295|nr:uncharacterized protein LOC130670126 [Microplitis mediator]
MNYKFVRIVLMMIVSSTALGRKLELEGNCSCAAIEVSGFEPILEQSLQFNVVCNEEGIDKCERLCIALVSAAKDKGPELICDKLMGHVSNMHVGLYTRICDANAWKFSGLKIPNPICCHEGKPTQCGDTQE